MGYRGRGKVRHQFFLSRVWAGREREEKQQVVLGACFLHFRDSSNEGSQHMFWLRNKKNYQYPLLSGALLYHKVFVHCTAQDRFSCCLAVVLMMNGGNSGYCL